MLVAKFDTYIIREEVRVRSPSEPDQTQYYVVASVAHFSKQTLQLYLAD